MVSPANILSPHLVPLPMGEETVSLLPFLFKRYGEGLANLTSPLGRGARQRGEGVSWQLGRKHLQLFITNFIDRKSHASG